MVMLAASRAQPSDNIGWLPSLLVWGGELRCLGFAQQAIVELVFYHQDFLEEFCKRIRGGHIFGQVKQGTRNRCLGFQLSVHVVRP